MSTTRCNSSSRRRIGGRLVGSALGARATLQPIMRSVWNASHALALVHAIVRHPLREPKWPALVRIELSELPHGIRSGENPILRPLQPLSQTSSAAARPGTPCERSRGEERPQRCMARQECATLTAVTPSAVSDRSLQRNLLSLRAERQVGPKNVFMRFTIGPPVIDRKRFSPTASAPFASSSNASSSLAAAMEEEAAEDDQEDAVAAAGEVDGSEDTAAAGVPMEEAAG